MMFSPPSYDTLSVQGFDLDSALFNEAQNSMDVQDFDLASMVSQGVPQMLPTPMPVLSTPEYMPQQTPSPNTSAPATPQSPQTPPIQNDLNYSQQQQPQQPPQVQTQNACMQMQISPCAPPELKYLLYSLILYIYFK